MTPVWKRSSLYETRGGSVFHLNQELAQIWMVQRAVRSDSYTVGEIRTPNVVEQRSIETVGIGNGLDGPTTIDFFIVEKWRGGAAVDLDTPGP